MLTLRRDFIDRVDQIQHLCEELHAEGAAKDPLVLAYGPAGIGKTQLFAKFLIDCNQHDIRVAYVDLTDKGYLGFIDDVEMGLGSDGFEELEQVLEDVMMRSPIEQGRLIAKRFDHEWEPVPDAREPAALSINAPINADHLNFAGRDVVYNNARISNVFNIIVGDPIEAQRLIEKKITQAFRTCLRQIARGQIIAILLDHWEEAQDPLRNWITEHLIGPATQFAMKKALVVLCRDDLPQEMEEQTGILPLPIPFFTREVALQYWVSHGLPQEKFDDLGPEVYSLPRLLAIEVDRQRLLRKAGR
jgi:hypothetical protein